MSRPISVVRGSVTTCSYKAPDPTHSVIIEFDTAANETSFASGRSTIESHHVTTTSIPGLGSGAYSFSERTSQNTVSTVVTFQGSLQTFVTGTSSMAQVTSMAEEILYKLDAHNTSTTSTISTTSATGATSTTSASG